MFVFNTFIEVTLASALVFFLCVKNRSPPNIILGIYRKNVSLYWPKYFFMLGLLKLRKITNKGDKSMDKFDCPQPLSNNKYAVDACYFGGSAKDREILITNMCRRRNNIANSYMLLRIPKFSEEILMTPKLPGTTLQTTDDESKTFSAEGIKYTPLVPMKKWRVEYNGKMRKSESGEEVEVSLKVEYNNKMDIFNYDTDMDPRTNADAIAREMWSKEYFDQLKNLHQTHYEQYGEIAGVAEINGKKYSLEIPAYRDHSFGIQRNWRLFHRYVMHLFSLENGDRVTVGIVSIPSTFSSIAVGFMHKAKENKNVPISSCDLQLYQHGENGTPPKDYAFSFVAGDEHFVVQVQGYLAPIFFFGVDREAKIVEMMSKFLVNGNPGWGVAEWMYRNVE